VGRACGRAFAGPSAVTLPAGPRLRALAAYLVVFQHVPVDCCRQLIALATVAPAWDGFIHSCPARAASRASEVVALSPQAMACGSTHHLDPRDYHWGGNSGPVRIRRPEFRKGEPSALTLRNVPCRFEPTD
jgi:hypothetical protein